MSRDDFDWTLAGRFLAGECTREQALEVERRCAADPAFAEELREARRLWDEAGALPAPSRTDAMWASLSARIRAQSPSGNGARAATPNAPRRHTPVLAIVPRRDVARRRLVAAALAAGVVLVAGLAAWRTRVESSVAATESPARVYATARGQRATVRLTDGTLVELGFASTLRVRPFESGRRELYLEGEAVFAVVHDSTRPFVVHTPGAVTEDLGTRFGVRHYPGDDGVRVVVMEGLVELRPQSAARGDTARRALLRPGQLGRLGGDGRLLVESGVDTSAYLSWLSGRVTFRNAPLREVADELGRRFDVPVRVPDDSVAALRVTLDLPMQSLPQIVDVVAVTLGLRHRRDAGGLVLER